MTGTQRESLRELLRRVDEVRGLSDRVASPAALSADDPDALIQTLGELVEELERSHRRVIETNVQLVSLREVASSMVSVFDTGETTRTVTRYLRQAFGFDQVFLLLLHRESGDLQGTWSWGRGERDASTALQLPLVGDQGALARSAWLHRTVVHYDPRRHPPAFLPEIHPLREVFERLGSMVCVPLQSSHAVLPAGGPAELCGDRCVLGDASLLVPPPGPAAESWAADRHERQQQCLSCELMPVLGVIGIARDADSPPLVGADVALTESIALSVAPVVESARLTSELRRSERFQKNVFDSMAAALVAVNMQGLVLTINRAAEELMGRRAADALGKSFGELFGSEGERLLRATLEHGREVQREEVLLRDRAGTPLPVSLTTSQLRNEKRAVYGAVATFVDLRPLKQAEERARQLDRLAALGRFTSSVAHEIRNPLTGIAAGVQYLAKALADDAPQRQNLEFILDEIQRLDRIVQDLFDVTHPRGLQIHEEPLADTVARALQSLEALLVERGIEVTLEVDPGAKPVAHDPDQLQQVFINLVKNAAEASPRGSAVTVSLRHGGRPELEGLAVVQVTDHGIGIPAEHLARIFEPFYTTKPGGTGLGLYICHDIVKRHGGGLTVQSEPERGTTFIVELPFSSQGGSS